LDPLALSDERQSYQLSDTCHWNEHLAISHYAESPKNPLDLHRDMLEHRLP